MIKHNQENKELRQYNYARLNIIEMSKLIQKMFENGCSSIREQFFYRTLKNQSRKTIPFRRNHTESSTHFKFLALPLFPVRLQYSQKVCQ